MTSSELFRNLYVPGCSDFVAMDLVKKSFALDTTVDYGKCILVKEGDELKKFQLLMMATEIRMAVLNYYDASYSFLWQPKTNDEVFWVTIDDPSAIKTIHVKHSFNAVHQFEITGNCYATEAEATGCQEAICEVLNKYHII